MPEDSMVRSVYVHVPFCARKCSYCAFYSEVPRGDLMDRYISALITEMERQAPRLQPRTLYFGGGTPTLLSLHQWKRLFGAMERLGVGGAEEWTVECNPGTLTPDKARLLRDHGVNRISMGVQSLDESLLERLGRIHTRAMVFESIETLRQVGFDNINLDFMFALPTQTLAAWDATLKEGLALGCEHLSSYEVIYEEDTPLFQQLESGAVQVDDELACDMYELLVERASEFGYRQYEIANFAQELPGRENERVPARACLHNLNYWRGGDYFAFGPSASGYVDGIRTRNWGNTQIYCERLEAGGGSIESIDELSPMARAGEIAAFGLRMTAGWEFEEFLAVTGYDLRAEWGEVMEQAKGRGLGVLDARGFRLSTQGLRFADAVAAEFLL